MEGSLRRRTPLRPIERDVDGVARCRFCNERVDRPRRTYCSAACADEAHIRRDPLYAAQLFRQRYGTRCADCGLDEEKARLAWQAAHTLLVDSRQEHLLLPWKGFELDHIRPVADRGGECGLDNYRLLCRPCHVGITGRWRKERAARRKPLGPWAASARQRAGYKVSLTKGG